MLDFIIRLFFTMQFRENPRDDDYPSFAEKSRIKSENRCPRTKKTRNEDKFVIDNFHCASQSFERSFPRRMATEFALLICDFSQLETLFTFLRILGMIFRAWNVIGSFFDVAVERYE